MPAREFLSQEEEQLIVEAINRAEEGTTGEIRVHIEFRCKKDPLERAETLFHELNMDQTERRNGTLLYIAVKDRKVAIYGDAGISSQVDDRFWQEEIDKLIGYFKEDKFEAGIENVVGDIGEKLKQFYPGETANPNELQNDISFKDNRNEKSEGKTDET
ncbi:MAG: TPM domain-containing protein [Balneolaceae bacterium]